MVFMWHNFWRPRWLLIWQIANFSPLTPRRFSSQDSKYPNMAQISQYGPDMVQISKYGPNMVQISKYGPNLTWPQGSFFLPRLQISKYGRKTSDIQIWAKYPNMGKISKYSNMGQISKYRQNIQIWAKYSNMGQIFKDGPNIQNMGQIWLRQNSPPSHCKDSKYPIMAKLKCEEMWILKRRRRQ